jgi:hypothetical protein
MQSNRNPIQQCGLSDGREHPGRRQRPFSPALIRPVSAVLLEHIKPNQPACCLPVTADSRPPSCWG